MNWIIDQIVKLVTITLVLMVIFGVSVVLGFPPAVGFFELIWVW